ncbi:hypothetical protein [Kineococcus glutinatus]
MSTGTTAATAEVVDGTEPAPIASDNRPRPQDGVQDVDQLPHLGEVSGP